MGTRPCSMPATVFQWRSSSWANALCESPAAFRRRRSSAPVMRRKVSFFDRSCQPPREPGVQVGRAASAGLLPVEVDHGQGIGAVGKPPHLPERAGKLTGHVVERQERETEVLHGRCRQVTSRLGLARGFMPPRRQRVLECREPRHPSRDLHEERSDGVERQGGAEPGVVEDRRGSRSRLGRCPCRSHSCHAPRSRYEAVVVFRPHHHRYSHPGASYPLRAA